jgi:L-ascorbate metabolism protein UlaG (beta-lactamase superfamily)
MKITWYGHAAFLVETNGARIMLDPFRSPDSGGYLPINEPADIVVVSHENDRYHSHLGQVVPPFEVVRALEIGAMGVTVRGITFHAIPVFETPEKLAADEVTIVHFRAEDLHVVHLGDLGHALSDAELEPIRGADIVMAAAGGPPTIDYPLISPLLDAIGPRVVIPMHYKTPRINLNIQPVDRFFEALADWPVVSINGSSCEMTRDTLPMSRRIVSLEHAR